MLAESIRFDDPTRASQSDAPLPPGGVLRALRGAAESTGLDPVAELYNEALRYATEGHLRLARERLQVLLGLAADDGEARLLLAKVHVAGQRWQEALGALDEAEACGEHVPLDLRHAVEEHLRADRAAEEEEGQVVRARELGEVKALRQEARRLRSENAQLVGRTHDLERETRRWAWTTASVSVLGVLFVAANLLFGSPKAASAPPAAPIAAVPAAHPAAATTPGHPAPAAAPAAAPTAIADKAQQALQTAPGLDGAALEVSVRQGSATLGGEVQTAKQKKLAEQVLLGVPGISKVDSSKATIAARTRGAHHTVGKGDTLAKIATEYYGDGSLSNRILDANPALKGKPNLTIGQDLEIPPLAP